MIDFLSHLQAKMALRLTLLILSLCLTSVFADDLTESEEILAEVEALLEETTFKNYKAPEVKHDESERVGDIPDDGDDDDAVSFREGRQFWQLPTYHTR